MQLDEPGFSVRSITGYQGLFNDYTMDVTRSAYSVLGLYEDLVEWNKTLKTYTEELDVLSPPGSKLEWIAGAFVFNQSAQAPTLEYEGSSPDPDTDPGILAIPPNVIGDPPSNLSYGNVTTVTRQGDGAFARLTYHATPKLRITLGARFNWDRYSDDSHNFSAYGASVVSHVYTDTVPTGRIEADYDVTADNMLYASASRGYKPGGLNGNNGQALVPDGFKAEINTALEVGAKNYFFDRTLTLNMAGYYYFYRDFQYIEYDPVPFDSGITNIPDIQEYGFEAEAAYHAPDGHLRLEGTLGLEHGQVVGKDLSVDSTIGQSIEGNPNGPCANGGEYYSQACWNQVIASAKNVQGNTPPAMPNVTASVTAAYKFDIPFGALTPRAQFVYRGHEWARIFNEPTLDSVKGYGVTNLYLEFAPTASRFRVSVAATNVFNVDGVNSRLTDPYGVYSTSEQFIPPRQVVASVAYSW
jgi:iron complex outermembrane receptor protein